MNRRLDAAVAHLLGYNIVYANTYEKGIIRRNYDMPAIIMGDCDIPCPLYSTDGHAMMELDREMLRRGYAVTIWYDEVAEGGEYKYFAVYENMSDRRVMVYGEKGDSIPEAVSKAAYKALSHKSWVDTK